MVENMVMDMVDHKKNGGNFKWIPNSFKNLKSDFKVFLCHFLGGLKLL